MTGAEEYYYPIHPTEFERGIPSRLKVGELAVAQSCELRYESPHRSEGIQNCFTMPIIITGIEAVNEPPGFVLSYTLEKRFSPSERVLNFNHDSMHYVSYRGQALRQYLSASITDIDWHPDEIGAAVLIDDVLAPATT